MNQEDSIVEGGRGALSALLQLTFIGGEDVWSADEKKHHNPQVGSHGRAQYHASSGAATLCECLAPR
jgi:hypothetical protein